MDLEMQPVRGQSRNHTITTVRGQRLVGYYQINESNRVVFDQNCSYIVPFSSNDNTTDQSFVTTRTEPCIVELTDSKTSHLSPSTLSPSTFMYPINTMYFPKTTRRSWFHLLGMMFVAILARVAISSSYTTSRLVSPMETTFTGQVKCRIKKPGFVVSRKKSGGCQFKCGHLFWNVFCALIIALIVILIVGIILYVNKSGWFIVAHGIMNASKLFANTMLYNLSIGSSQTPDRHPRHTKLTILPPLSTPPLPLNASTLISRVLNRQNISLDRVAYFCSNNINAFNIEECQVDWDRFGNEVAKKLNAELEQSEGDDTGYHLRLLLNNGNVFALTSAIMVDTGVRLIQIDMDPSSIESEPEQAYVKWAIPMGVDKLLLINEELHYCVLWLKDPSLRCVLVNPND